MKILKQLTLSLLLSTFSIEAANAMERVGKIDQEEAKPTPLRPLSYNPKYGDSVYPSEKYLDSTYEYISEGKESVGAAVSVKSDAFETKLSNQLSEDERDVLGEQFKNYIRLITGSSTDIKNVKAEVENSSSNSADENVDNSEVENSDDSEGENLD